MAGAPPCPYFLGPQDPPIRVVKHICYGPEPLIRKVKPTLYVPDHKIRLAFPYTFTPIPPQYGLRGSPDSHNMASIQPKTAQHDPNWPSDSKGWPQMVPRHTNMIPDVPKTAQDGPKIVHDGSRSTLVLMLSNQSILVLSSSYLNVCYRAKH